MTMSQRIRERRKYAGFSQSDLAERLGVSAKTVARWENGERIPNALFLELLEMNLKTTYDYLMGTTDDPSPRVILTNKKMLHGNGQLVAEEKSLDGKRIHAGAEDNSRSTKKEIVEESDMSEGKIVYEHVIDNHGFQETTRLYFPNGTPPAYMSEVVKEVKGTFVEKGEDYSESMRESAEVGENSA